MYDLDTNMVAYFFKGMGGVSERLLATPPAAIAVSAIVAYELAVGVAKSPEATRRSEQLQRFLSVVTVVPFGPAEGQAAAIVRADLEGRGLPIGPLHVLIAGSALARGATLVTRNTHEFMRVPGLRVEDWFQPGS
ncbi:ribonuclease VapC [Deltaproteobacteria bacterium]|nr:ribonuclease VapC [Deltaproteobacteria bacterium]